MGLFLTYEMLYRIRFLYNNIKLSLCKAKSVWIKVNSSQLKSILSRVDLGLGLGDYWPELTFS